MELHRGKTERKIDQERQPEHAGKERRGGHLKRGRRKLAHEQKEKT